MAVVPASVSVARAMRAALGPLACAVLLTALTASPVAAALWVSPSGSDTTGTGTQASPFATIQRAYDAASVQGETIRVLPGIYAQCVNATGQTVQVAGQPVAKYVHVVADDPTPANTTLVAATGCTTMTIGGLGGSLTGFRVIAGEARACWRSDR
jgi:hypothetical protein